MTRRNVHLPDPQVAALEKLAKKTGLTVAELIRRAIDEYLAAQPEARHARRLLAEQDKYR